MCAGDALLRRNPRVAYGTPSASSRPRLAGEIPLLRTTIDRSRPASVFFRRSGPARGQSGYRQRQRRRHRVTSGPGAGPDHPADRAETVVAVVRAGGTRCGTAVHCCVHDPSWWSCPEGLSPAGRLVCASSLQPVTPSPQRGEPPRWKEPMGDRTDTGRDFRPGARSVVGPVHLATQARLLHALSPGRQNVARITLGADWGGGRGMP